MVFLVGDFSFVHSQRYHMSLGKDEGHMGLFAAFIVFSFVDNEAITFKTCIAAYN